MISRVEVAISTNILQALKGRDCTSHSARNRSAMLLLSRLTCSASSMVAFLGGLPPKSPPSLRKPQPVIGSSSAAAAFSFARYSSSAADQPVQKEPTVAESSKSGPLISGLYLVSTPIGNLEDITLRALRILKSANVILAEDTRHSRKLLQHYNIKTPLISYHKFNESERGTMILRRLQQGDVVALISDAGTPCISDPGMELAKLCVSEKIPVVPIPGPSAPVSALSVSGFSTNEFRFVGFLPKHAGTRRERLEFAANDTATQIFFVPPHKLHQFLDESSSIFGCSRSCVIAREMTKFHEEFWRGTLSEAQESFANQHLKGEITLLIEGKTNLCYEVPSDDQLVFELKQLISNGHTLSMAVKLIAEGTSAKRKRIYALALRVFGKEMEAIEYMD